MFLNIYILETVTSNDFEAAIMDIFAKQLLLRGINIIRAGYGKNNSIYETQAVKKIGTVFSYIINI